MSFSSTLVLGALSGFTIFFGMPLARFRAVSRAQLSFLNALAVGILFFLFTDIVEHAVEPLEEATELGISEATLLFVILIAGFSGGLLGPLFYGRHALRHTSELPARSLALLIAAGIGLHNFSEGLAIGNAAVQGAWSLSLLLIIGFGLHNITEAFGIVAPLLRQRVSWKFLLLLGLIAGGPNFLGTLLGYIFHSDLLAILFLALAGGAMMYVISEMLAAGRKLESHVWMGWGLISGFVLALGADVVLVAVGT
ncbi:hypothetical protein AUJ46_00390 [Candidatus Peregrinibacteria bacterium CG1_02_54_53]|nr:MAG: hypothetical protein AUJ46_00390 [Candidatus Peregrinibacteria bacterium CG1_02_54_53]